MVKILISLIILFLAIYIAYMLKKFGNERIDSCNEKIEFIKHIKKNILYYNMPTGEIINGYKNRKLRESGFIEDFKRYVSTGDADIELDNDMMISDILQDFSAKLGRSSREDQISNCDYAIDSLREIYEKYKSDTVKRYKAYSSLALIIGFFLIILLV